MAPRPKSAPLPGASAEVAPRKTSKRSSPTGLRRNQSFWWAAGLYVVLTGIFFASAAPNLLDRHTPYNHFAHQAHAWLSGRVDLGGPPPYYTGNNDFAVYQGKYFVSFPPFPSLLILPVTFLAGSVERVRDGQFFLWLAAIGPALWFLALERLRDAGRLSLSRWSALGLSAALGVGTVYWFSAVQGTVWFAAHVVTVGLVAGYILASLEGRHPVWAGLCLGLAVATRPTLFFALPFFVFELLGASLRAEARFAAVLKAARTARPLGALLRFATPMIAIGLLLGWYNFHRFGDPLEFGHRHLNIVWRDRIDTYGLFSTHYLPKNLSVIFASIPFFKQGAAPFQISGHGLALWITTPLYLGALAIGRKHKAIYWTALLTALLVAIPSLLYQNTGWIQFGYRFSNDYAPFLLLAVATARPRMPNWLWALALWGVVVNGFGALTFQRADFSRFYFLDPTQSVVFEPD